MRRVLIFILLFFTIRFLTVEACPVRLTTDTPVREVSKAKEVIVEDEVDLKSARLILRDNAKMVFKGGTISNGEVVFKNTTLSGDVKLYCHVSGKIRNNIVYVDWFLPKNDLDVLYEHGVFNLKGYETLIFQQSLYETNVRGKNNGICLNNVTFEGKGATIRAKGGGSTVNSLLVFTECNNIVIRNFALKGTEFLSNEEGARHNLCLNKCKNTTIENVISNDAFTDGLYIRKCDNVKVRGVEAYRSGRQGSSLTAGTNICFEGCIFDGSYRTAPKSGFDIEPNYSNDPINNIKINNCRFTNNAEAGLTIKLRQGETDKQCNITIENCYFEGNAANITLRSAQNSGKGEIEIKNCTLRNSKGVSFQSKCYSALGTPVVKFHDSILENANTADGSDVREQAAIISVHNISSKPLKGEFGNIHFYNLSIKQDEKLVDNLKNAIVFYPDDNAELSNVSATAITFDIKRKEDRSFKFMSAPKHRTNNVCVEVSGQK